MPLAPKLPFDQTLHDASRPTRSRLWLQFVFGILYLAMISSILSTVLKYPFLSTFAVVLGGTLVCSALALIWITRWAQRRDSKLGQFGIGSLMFLMLFAAIYCTVIRSIISRITELEPSAQANSLKMVAAIGAFVAAIILFSIPLVIHLVESLIKAAVWLIRQRWLRQFVTAFRRKKA